MSDETKDVLASMLKENTGKHFLDSGMDSNRHWQRNQGRDFDAEEPSTLKYDYDYINVTHNVFHWLADRLEYDAEMDKKFHKWAALGENRDEGWLQLMEKFVERLQKKGKAKEDFGYYGQAPMTVNTYNGEDLLSQTLQYTGWTDEESGEDFILLQIHGGADVRGGYTKPRAFRVMEEAAMFDNARASIFCDACEANWTTDDGHYWYDDGACGYGAGTQLEKYDVQKLEDLEGLVTCKTNREPHEKHKHDGERDPLCTFAEEVNPEDFIKEGHLVVTKDGELLCPKCGQGRLKAGFY